MKYCIYMKLKEEFPDFDYKEIKLMKKQYSWYSYSEHYYQGGLIYFKELETNKIFSIDYLCLYEEI